MNIIKSWAGTGNSLRASVISGHLHQEEGWKKGRRGSFHPGFLLRKASFSPCARLDMWHAQEHRCCPTKLKSWGPRSSKSCLREWPASCLMGWGDALLKHTELLKAALILLVGIQKASNSKDCFNPWSMRCSSFLNCLMQLQELWIHRLNQRNVPTLCVG